MASLVACFGEESGECIRDVVTAALGSGPAVYKECRDRHERHRTAEVGTLDTGRVSVEVELDRVAAGMGTGRPDCLRAGASQLHQDLAVHVFVLPRGR